MMDDDPENQAMVDTFVLNIFGLLFCKGTIESKAQILFETIIGPNGLKAEKNIVSCRSKRMTKAFKFLVYFSDVFPKKYWKEFMSDKTLHE